MANSIKGTKRSVERILASKGNTSLPTDGVSINGTGGIVNLSDGQVALLDVTPQSSTFNQFFNNTGNQTFNAIPVAKVVQGTDQSANPSQARVPFTRLPYESSVEIYGDQVISYLGKAYSAPYNSATDFLMPTTVADNAVYSIYMGFRGRRVTEFDSGIQAVVKKFVQINTPTLSTLGFSSNQDWLATNIVDFVDRNSAQFQAFFGNFGGNWRVIAFKIDVSGGAGVAINTIVAGTSVPVITASGSAKNLVFTQEYVDTLAQVVANNVNGILGTSTIELTTLSTAGAGTGDCVLLLAMDEVTAYVDRDPTLKIRIDVGLADMFQEQGLVADQCSNPYEGQGTYRQWLIYFQDTMGQREYSQNRSLYPILLYPTDSLDSATTYAAIVIEHYIKNQVQFTGTSNSPHKTIVLVPSTSTAKATIVGAFNKWLAPSFPAISL